MEAKVCKHFQTGYCKFGSKGCRKQHIEEICSTPKCSSKSCDKRHPKNCKYFSFQQVCKFGDQCLYKHSISSNKSDIDVLIHDVKLLKATIVILGDKVSDLENEIITIKSESGQDSKSKSVGETGLQEKYKCKESESGEELVQAKVSKSVKKLKAQLNKAISVKKSKSGKKVISCDLCEYKYKKIITLTNHQDYKDNDNIECSSGDEIFNLSEIK
jgi:hypothetical protein